MTESEALEIIKRKSSIPMENESFDDICEAYDMAITAMEEIQQYRAIGTVEELKTLHNDYWKLNEICKEYSAIGTVSEFQQLKEKATAKKPIDVRYFAEAGYSIGLCPTCNSGINSEFKYCGDCCQCLDWSEGKE